MLDYLIKNITIVDGSGEPPFIGNVGIQGDKIVLGPRESDAAVVLDGTGKHLTPGFIDFHSHGDLVLGEDFARLCKVSQGITTEIAGQCGSSMFPIDPDRLSLHQALLSIGAKTFPSDMENWNDFSRYLEYARTLPLSANIAFFVGHGTLRLAVMGYECREPSPEELERMKALLRTCMEHGAMGLSSGLIYTPSAYAKTEELVELAKIVAQYDGFYATHMRNESDSVIDAVREAIQIGEQSNVKVLISHHKICGKQNWGQSEETLALIDQAIRNGVDITFDQYPYTASMTHLNACIPPWYFTHGIPAMAEQLKIPAIRKKIRQEMEDPKTPFDNYVRNCGGFDGVFISSCPLTPEADGKFVTEYAAELGKDPYDAFFDLLSENHGLGIGIYHCMSEEDLCRVIKNGNAVVGTDGICRDFEEKAHPRAFGTFIRAICYFHKEKRLFSFEEMIRKMTSLPAKRAGLAKKGLIRDGYDADLLILDYPALEDTPDYIRSNVPCKGVDLVFVNGRPVWQDGKLTDEAPGRILLHNKSGATAAS